MNKLIALNGEIGSGKSTVADMLEDILWLDYQLDYRAMAFAEPLKRAIAGLTGCRIHHLDEQDFKASPSPIKNTYGGQYTYRQLMQIVGDKMRELNPEIFIDRTLDSYDKDPINLIIPDARVRNEFEAIKARGGIIIRVVRPELTHTDPHPSENGWRGWTFDYTLINDGTLSDLRQKVKALLIEINEKEPLTRC